MQTCDRRSYPRLEGEFQVDLLNLRDDPTVSPWEAIVVGKALDVSRHGIKLKIPYQAMVGTNLSAIVYYQGFQSVCLCRVVWTYEALDGVFYGLYIDQWSHLDMVLDRRLAAMEQRKMHLPR